MNLIRFGLGLNLKFVPNSEFDLGYFPIHIWIGLMLQENVIFNVLNRIINKYVKKLLLEFSFQQSEEVFYSQKSEVCFTIYAVAQSSMGNLICPLFSGSKGTNLLDRPPHSHCLKQFIAPWRRPKVVRKNNHQKKEKRMMIKRVKKVIED